MSDTKTLIARAEEALEGLTDGPWGYIDFDGHNVMGPPGHVPTLLCEFESQANARFTAKARTLVPDLIAALKEAEEENLNLLTTCGQNTAARRRLDEENARYRAALERIQNAFGDPNAEDYVTETARAVLAGETK
jgi:hypothetical protein